MRVDEDEVVEDSTRIASRHATRGMKIDQRTRCEDRDDASISKVVEWFRARSRFFSLSLFLLSALSSSYRRLPPPSSIESLFVGEYVRGNLDLNYSQFSLSHFQLYLARVRVSSDRRADDVSDRVSISRLSRNRGYLPLLNRPHGIWTQSFGATFRFDGLISQFLLGRLLRSEFATTTNHSFILNLARIRRKHLSQIIIITNINI